MRTQFIALFVLLGLIVGGHVEAQTWEQPYVLWPNGTGSSTTCGSSTTIYNFDGWGSGIAGPDNVYQIQTLQYPPHLIKPGFATTQYLTLVPESSVDFEVFVCQYKFGYDAVNCDIEADNIYYPGSPIQVTIPPKNLTFHIIVTSGMLNGNYNYYGQGCGAYTLITSRH